jgi:hypothetical protein
MLEYEDYCPLKCDAMQPSILLPEYEGNWFTQNVYNCLEGHAATHLRKEWSE